jgi:hypothetical protein
MGNPKGNRFGVDVLWFRHAIADARLSANGLAVLLGIQKSELSRKINGKRGLSIKDARGLSKELGKPLQDVLRAGNVATGTTLEAPVIGHDDDAGIFVPRAPQPDASTYGIILVTMPGMSVAWRVPVLMRATANVRALKDSLPGLVTTADGRQLLRTIRSGSKPGMFDLLPAFGLGERENDVGIVSVNWVVPDILG